MGREKTRTPLFLVFFFDLSTISSLDEVLEKVSASHMKQLLTESKGRHEKLRDEIFDQLMRKNSEEKEPNPLAKSMSWLKTNMKIGMDDSDATVADLIKSEAKRS